MRDTRRQLWHIYHVDIAEHTDVAKRKFVVVVCKRDYYHGFYINTNKHPGYETRPDLEASQVEIRCEEHRCLSYDSYVDCSTIYEFPYWVLRSKKDALSEQACQDILEAVRESRTLEPIFKRLIEESHSRH